MNNSSAKTKNIIRKTFAEMLSEKKEIRRISVSELVKRANINRSTFYSHYNDIYGVAEDYENELVEFFFDNTTLLEAENSDQFLRKLFEFFHRNEDNYRLISKSNDAVYSANKLANLSEIKLLELCYNCKSLKNKEHLEVELCVFVEGLVSQFMKHCRGTSDITADELYAFAKEWRDSFYQKHFSSQE